MPGIFIMAVIATVVALLVAGTIFKYLARPEDRTLLLAMLCIELPMCALAYDCVRVPLDHLLRDALGVQSPLYLALNTLYAPMTEEPSKFWPALLPLFRHRLTRQNFALCAIALGFGFGIGELWFIASLVNASPTPPLPWYGYFPFLNERMMVCILHSAFTSMVIAQLRPRTPDEPPANVPLGIAAAVALHWALNFPVFLPAIIPGFPKAVLVNLVTVWIVLFFVGAIVLLQAQYTGKWTMRELLGTQVCPECNREYPRPLFAVSLGPTRRLERCPYCRHWHKL